MAGIFADALYGPGSPRVCRRYDDVLGKPAAFVCERELTTGEHVTVMVGARTDLPPVLLHYSGGVTDSICTEQARDAAAAALGCDSPQLAGRTYYSPFDIWLEYAHAGRSVMVSLRDFAPAEPGLVRSTAPVAYPAGQRTLFAEQWKSYLAGAVPGLADGQRWIDGVADWDWHFGCAPTAAANVLTYWDSRGYDRLVEDVQYGVVDPIEGDADSVPDVSRELAIAMATDTSGNGSTAGSAIPSGIAAVCNDEQWGNEYGFTSWLSWDNLELLVAEVDSGRPGVLCLLGHPEYGNHTVTFCGWGPPSRDWIMVHDCWGGTPRDVVLNSSFGGPIGVVPVRPPAPAGPADVSAAGFVRPVAEGSPGAFAPEVRVSNQGGRVAEAKVFLRVLRPGGGLDEGFSDTLQFPPAGWSRFSPGGMSRWQSGGRDSIGESGWAECRPGAEASLEDDWLVTPRVRVGPADSLRFTVASAGQGHDSVEVWASTGETDELSFATLLGALGCGAEPAAAAIGFGTVGDTAASVGFRYVGGPGARGLLLDDVVLPDVHYAESAQVCLTPGSEESVLFRPWEAPLGHYVASCSLYCSSDERPENDTALLDFVVSRRAHEPQEIPPRLGPTLSISPSLVRGAAHIAGWRGRAEVRVFDAVGRSVATYELESPGRLDCSGLSAGAYVVLVRDSAGRSAATRLIVIQ